MQRKKLWKKLQGMKEQHECGQRDITFLQETHLLTTEEEMAAGQYAAMWGFKQQCASHNSFWSSGAERRAGVAILANPYGAYQHLEPWGQHYWSEHLIMVKGTLAGQVFLFVNIYAPSHRVARIKFMKNLQAICFPQDWVLICGGDFNCVVDREVDRFGGSRKADIGASELARLADEKDDIASYIAQYQDQWKRIDLTELDADIMEDEVAEAIRRCKPGKAAGSVGKRVVSRSCRTS
ncbi:hypothetical protein PF005_g3024 [Phytophthora fragariae]|uniref:Endonuclease/exonuclease/phosphatase domain-containing protein n=1 Tax=Phytophthora fragariae TaxID=53985 RepID=A0A6A3FQ29_9STRA|nr:hypothetical protein PF009_g3275 [Phytophthora fragariae]KAE9231640.1 hypothetical protein PF005_g3024 [Phytophthora fragariae]KAE9253176.1 hypothetical protein PF002_g3466 [Phytophthora fragariae]